MGPTADGILSAFLAFDDHDDGDCGPPLDFDDCLGPGFHEKPCCGDSRPLSGGSGSTRSSEGDAWRNWESGTPAADVDCDGSEDEAYEDDFEEDSDDEHDDGSDNEGETEAVGLTWAAVDCHNQSHFRPQPGSQPIGLL